MAARAVVARKVEGLTLEDAKRVTTPTGLSPLGVVAHLAAVEYGWFDETFLGNPVRQDLDDHGEFQLHADDTVASVVDEYAEACAHSRRRRRPAPRPSTTSSALDTTLRGHVKLRWILVHMIEETARHAGHLDLMREQIDGRTGD